jgi:predicted DCC family thiol-disulfide oxidoreductase YuxK
MSKFLTILTEKITNLFSIDLRALVAFRITIGIIIILDLLQRLPHIVAFYTDFGFMPREALLELFANPHRISIHTANGQLWFQLLLFALAAIAALCMIVGYRTRVATILSWFLLISLHNRNELILQGGDNLFHLLLFWSMFLPLGASFSLDKAWGVSQLDPDSEENKRIFSMGTVAFLVQVFLAFFMAALLKTGPEWVKDFSATMYAGSVNYLSTPLSRWALSLHYPPLMQAWTIFLLGIEFVGPLLLFIPWKNHWFRIPSIVLLWAMLVGCNLGLQIALFPAIFAASLIPFIPSQVWDWFTAKNTPKEKLKFYYDKECSMCATTACALKNKVETITTESNEQALTEMLQNNTMTVEDEQGNKYYKFSGIVKILSLWPINRPLVWVLSLKPVMAAGDFLYTIMAKNRYRISKIIEFLKPKRLDLNFPLWPLNFVIAFLMLYGIIWNIGEVNPDFKMTQQEQTIGWTLNLNQRWDMFAPHPMKVHGWFVMPGRLVDGTDVDVFSMKVQPVSWEKQVEPPSGFRTQSWRKYFVDFLPNSKSKVQLYYGQYLCRSWNTKLEGQPMDKKLNTFEIYFMRQITQPDGSLTQPEKVKLWEHRCL